MYEQSGNYKALNDQFFDKFIVTEKQYQQYTDHEKQCRHIIQVRIGDDFQWLYITERGIQTKVAENRWKPWSTNDVEFNISQKEWRRDGVGWDGAPTRAFVCRKCTYANTGKTRWLMKCDPGRFPKDLEPLGVLEQIVLNRFVIYGQTNKMGCMTTSTGARISRGKRLYGHMVAQPLSTVEVLKSECKTIPRKKFAKYAAQICFIGSSEQYKAIRALTFRHGIYQLRIDVLKKWMRFMGMETELQRLIDDEEGYKAAWANEFAELEKMTIANDGAIFHDLNARASSDVAGMAPQVLECDDATQQRATGGFQSYVGVMPMSTEVDRLTRLKWLQSKVNPEDVVDANENIPNLQVKAHLADKLMNEFEVNDEIIYIHELSSVGGHRPLGCFVL